MMSIFQGLTGEFIGNRKLGGMYITLVILLHPPKIRSAFAEIFSWKQVFYVLVQENVRYLLQKLHDLPEALQYNKPFFALDYHAVEISRKGAGADDRNESAGMARCWVNRGKFENRYLSYEGLKELIKFLNIYTLRNQLLSAGSCSWTMRLNNT